MLLSRLAGFAIINTNNKTIIWEYVGLVKRTFVKNLSEKIEPFIKIHKRPELFILFGGSGGG